MGRVKGKVAIVTGGAKGIGRATAELLAHEGARVIIADIDAARGRAAATKIGRRARFVRHDVREEEDWKALVDQVRREFCRIDVLVNNAGIYLIKPVARTTVEEFENIHATNVRGVFLGMKHVAPVMARQRRGSIINIASMDGNVGSEGHTAYGGSKGAVRTMTKDVAVEYAKKGVRVNSIHPGLVHTPMSAGVTEEFMSPIPMRRGAWR